MKKLFIFLLILLMSKISFALDREKGKLWKQSLIFKKSLLSERDNIPANNNSSILLDYTVKPDSTTYTATQNRSQAFARSAELSDVEDYYVGWYLDFCGQTRNITAYSPSVDADDVVIGRFTLESAFDKEPDTGVTMFLLNPDQITEIEQRLMIVDSGNQINIGDNNNVAIVHNSPRSDDANQDGFVEYEIGDDDNQVYLAIAKPTKTDSINTSTFCVPFSTFAAFADVYISKIGFYLDSVPANTKCRVLLIGRDKLDTRYPLVENVTQTEFNRGSGDAVSVSTYADETTWNLIEMSDPAIARKELNFDLLVSFSDENGNARNIDVPIDASLTDAAQFRKVRDNNIQSASGTSITLDVGASSRDDDYIGMRLYIGAEYRDITDYNGTTKVATVASVYTSTPNPNDNYIIKIAYTLPMITYVYKTTIKGQIQNTHNYRYLDNSNDDEYIKLGTINYVDTTTAETTLQVPVQSSEYLYGWFKIVDEEGTFDINNLIIDFSEFDPFENTDPAPDYTCNRKGATYTFRHIDDSYGWTVEYDAVDRCAITKSADQTISNATWTAIAFDQEKYDTNVMHDNVTNNTRITIKTAGDYRINYHVKHDAMDKTLYETRIKKNGSTIIDGTCDVGFGSKDASVGTLGDHSYLIPFAVNDYIELEFYHDEGTTQDVLSSNTFFECYQIL